MQSKDRASAIEEHILETQMKIIDQAAQLAGENLGLDAGRELLDRALVHLVIAKGACFSPGFLSQTYSNHQAIEERLFALYGERCQQLHESES